MSLEKTLKALESLGVTRLDAQVYIYLEKEGTCIENDLLIALNILQNQLRLSLRNLIEKEMITRNTARLTRYSAIPLEKILDEFTEKAVKEVTNLQENKQTILETWRSAIERSPKNT